MASNVRVARTRRRPLCNPDRSSHSSCGQVEVDIPVRNRLYSRVMTPGIQFFQYLLQGWKRNGSGAIFSHEPETDSGCLGLRISVRWFFDGRADSRYNSERRGTATYFYLQSALIPRWSRLRLVGLLLLVLPLRPFYCNMSAPTKVNVIAGDEVWSVFASTTTLVPPSTCSSIFRFADTTAMIDAILVR